MARTHRPEGGAANHDAIQRLKSDQQGNGATVKKKSRIKSAGLKNRT